LPRRLYYSGFWMSEKTENKARFKFYEYILYWAVTAVILILGVPLLIIKGIGFLIQSAANPVKSIWHVFGFVLILLIVAGGYLSFKIFYPYNIGYEVKSVIIDDEHTFGDAITSLKNKNVLKDSYLFRQIVVRSKIDKQIAPGRYDFFGKVSLWDIYQKFKNRDIATVMVTIPEGLPSWKIASIFAGQLQVDSAVFMRLVFDSAYTRNRYSLPSLEGYLFPETYRMWYGIDAGEVIDIMVSEFFRQTDGMFTSVAPNGLKPEEVMTLASIIEAEVSDNTELGMVSSVYHNRLEKRMMLQADPTVIYGIGGLDRPLNRRDIRLLESPYNTYKKYGLPPGPINSPGLEAIKAAFKPDSTDYLYFVADGKGGHVFSTSLMDHNRAKIRIKRQQSLPLDNS